MNIIKSLIYYTNFVEITYCLFYNRHIQCLIITGIIAIAENISHTKKAGKLMAKVINIFAQKGGVAKTSTIIETAAVLKIRGYKVLVIDLDQQCSLTKNVGGNISGQTIYEVMHAECTINDAVQHLELFDLITGSASLSKVADEITDDEDLYLLKDIIELVDNEYDYVFIDNNPGRSNLVTMTYIASDYFIIPTECDEGSKDAVVTTQQDINMLKTKTGKKDNARILGYILSRYENTTMHQLALEDLQKLAAKSKVKPKPFVAKVRKSIKVSEAKTLHSSVVAEYKGLPLADDFVNIADEIIKRTDK